MEKNRCGLRLPIPKLRIQLVGKGRQSQSKKWLLIGLDGFLTVFLIILVSYAAYMILAKLNPWGLDSDVANDISFRRMSWEQKSFYPEGFVGPHYPLAVRTVLIYWFFYALTADFLLAFQLENITSLILILCALYVLMGTLQLTRTIKLASLCMFMAFLPECMRLVVFYPGNYYTMLLLAAILTMALRSHLWKSFDGWKRIGKRSIWRSLGAILLFSALIGYSTIQLAIFLYIPLLCVDACEVLLNFINKRLIERLAIFKVAVSGASLVINVLFYAGVIHFHGDSFNPPQFQIGSISDWLDWDVLSSQIEAVLLSLGFSGGGILQSLSGVRFLLSCCMVVLEVCSVVWLLNQGQRKPTERARSELVLYWLAATVVMFLMQVLTAVRIPESRYYIITAIFLPVICGTALTEWCNRGNGKTVLWPVTVTMFCLLLFFGTSVKQDAVKYSDQPSQLTQVAQYIEENGYKYVTASFGNAGIITGFTNGAVDYQHSNGWGGIYSLEPFRWLIDTRKFEQERKGEPNILLLTDEEEAVIRDQASYMYRMLQNYSEKIQEFGPYNLYRFSENPFTLIKQVEEKYSAGLPSLDQASRVDSPANVGFFYQYAELNKQNELVSDGTAGLILWGPYTGSVPGIYDITLFYEIDSCKEDATGTVDVALDTQSWAAATFSSGATSITLEGVAIEEGHSFEVRVGVPEGMIVRIKSIEYRRR